MLQHFEKTLLNFIGYFKVSGAFSTHGKNFIHRNTSGVEVSLRPSMSWQVWWSIPLSLISGNTSRAIIIS